MIIFYMRSYGQLTINDQSKLILHEKYVSQSSGDHNSVRVKS